MRKSIYFPDELWPRVRDAAELDNRSVSQWVCLALEQKLAASEPFGGARVVADDRVPPDVMGVLVNTVTGEQAPVSAVFPPHLPSCRCPMCKPPKERS